MAVRQYIGARYVPKFVGLWNNTTIYNALEVVDNGSGTSYIARKTVPAGTPLTNTEFWFVYGASSGAILNLQSQIDTINNTDLPGIDSRLDAHDDIIDAYNNAVNVKNKKILVIGDSIGDTSLSYLQPNYFTYLKSKLEDLGATVDNNSVGGRCIAPNSGYSDLVASLPSITGSYDYIIVELGINDWQLQHTSADISSAISQFYAWLLANQPHAQVFWVTPLSTKLDITKIPVAYYRDCILHDCVSHAISIIDAYGSAPLYQGLNGTSVSMYTTDHFTSGGDGVHPNPTYAPYYADFIVRSFLAGGSPINMLGTATFTTGLTFNNTPVNGYYRPGGKIQLMGGYNASYSATAGNLLIGQLPAWAKPYTNLTRVIQKGITLFVRSDGKVYLVFDETKTYLDVNVNIDYNALNNTLVSLS